MANLKERHLLNAMQSLVLYAGGNVSKHVKSLKNVVYSGRPRKRRPERRVVTHPVKRQSDGSAIFRMVSSKNPITDYSRPKVPMAG